MIAYPSMLLRPAKEAGIKVPVGKDFDNQLETWDAEKYPHFTVFCNLQLGKRMATPNEHWENAKVVAAVPESEIKTITIRDLEDRGFSY